MASLLLVSLVTAGLVGCSAASERALLSQFFAASRLRDTTALQSIATIVFEPRAQGIITDFTITGVVSHRGEGGSVSKAVSISAPVRLPSGQMTRKDLVIMMQYDAGHWIVTAITDAPPPPGSPSTPPS